MKIIINIVHIMIRFALFSVILFGEQKYYFLT